MRRRHGVTGATVIGLVIAAAMNWQYVTAYATNWVGEPSQTSPARMVDADDPPEVRFAVAGDVGTGGVDEYQTAEAMDVLDEAYPFDALLMLGDNVYDDGDPAELQTTVYDPFAEVLDGDTELLAVLGNHDIRDGNGPAHATALGMPGFWYSQTVGNVLVVALDSNQPSNPQQLDWLQATLSDTEPDWTIVIMHHPAYSGGWHGSEKAVLEHFVPLFEANGVDLVLSGHEHDYQRIEKTNGVTYVITGAAARKRRTGREDFTEVAWSTHSFVDLAVRTERIDGQAIDHEGRAIDSFVIEPNP